MDRKYEINDKRTKKDFSRISFSGYKRSEVDNLLKKCMLENKIEQSQYWCAELVCIGEFDKLWELFYLFTSKHIHIANTRIFPYLESKYDVFETIKSTGYHDFELAMRNNMKIRECFAEIVFVLCVSPKMPVLTPLKIKKDELSILNLQGRLRANSLEHGKDFINKDDAEELIVFINELSFLCFEKSQEYINKLHDILFWVHWLFAYDEHCRKNNINLQCSTRQQADRFLSGEQKKDVVWIIWDIILEANLTLHDTYLKKQEQYVKQNENYKKFIHRILESLLFFFKLKFTHACKKRKISLLYFAFQLLFMPIDVNINLLTREDKNKLEIIKGNINSIYEKIKENEIKPETDYLFNNTTEHENNLCKTQKRLELINDVSYK
jgi:hypothetical protein